MRTLHLILKANKYIFVRRHARDSDDNLRVFHSKSALKLRDTHNKKPHVYAHGTQENNEVYTYVI